MPGPHNAKKKKRGQKKKKNHTNSKTHTNTSPPTAHTTHDTVSDLSSLVTLLTVTTPGVPVVEEIHPNHSEGVPWQGHDAPGSPGLPYGPTDDPTLILLSNPIIHDPGNGPRVKNMRAFLNSSFSQPACMDDPLCAEFAQREILQMLCTVLPEETALCLWYNKSRRIGRVCPACLRLYTLLDAPPDTPTRLLSEQIISGLCSPICFMLAAHRSPIAAKVAWGRMAEDLDDATWGLLDELEPPRSTQMTPTEAGVGLGMLLKMTRLHDLGLAQLCVPDLVPDEESSGRRTQKEREAITGARTEAAKGGAPFTERHHLQREHTLTA